MSWESDHDDFWMGTPKKSKKRGFGSLGGSNYNDGLDSLYDPFHPYYNYNSQRDDVDEDL
ncbi:MAG: hypothetical protein IJ816_03200 [Alloprevotella sp.]|nr:hypothetical protein [Alloprevotella sp.]